jgi:LysR family transcriptional regulator of abg operon
MKFGQLMALVASVQAGGIRAGARRLGLNQAAVTRSLKELELEIGIPLIVRTSRGIQLTTHGEIVYDRASTIANQMARLEKEMANLRDADSIVVSFNVPVILAMTILPPVLTNLQKTLPNTHFNIGEGNISSALPMLRNGELDFVISLTNGMEIGSEFVTLPLLRCEAKIVAQKGHPLGNARSISELLDAQWVLTPDEEMTRGGKHYLFRQCGLPMPRNITRCRTTAVGLPLVFAGNAVAIMATPLLKLNFMQEMVDVIPIAEKLPLLTYSLISRSDIPPSSAASHICRSLKRHSHEWGFMKA